MDQRIVEFISALRASGVRISLAESADAFFAVEQMGVKERDAFQIALRATLVKEHHDQEVFDRLFPLYFQPAQPPVMDNPSAELGEEDAKRLAQALKRFSQELRDAMKHLLEGKPLTPEELQRLDRMVNMDRMTETRYQDWLARQLENAMKFREVRQALEELMKLLNEMGMNRQRLDQLRQALQANQQAIKEQLRQHAGESILRNLAEKGSQEPRDGVLDRPFSMLTEDDMRQVRREVRRLAASLRTRLALRLRRQRTGQLDPKATLRANLKHGSVPFDLRHRDRVRKPKVVVLCDISTSMRYCSEMMLSLLYEIQGQMSKTHAFTFIDRLEYVTPYFDHHPSAEAIHQVLRRMPGGHYNTDLGHALTDLNAEYLATIDPRTTLIVVGDGRNNFNDPQIELFNRLSRRSRKTIWLNPEPMALWGSGDSDMHLYAPLCTRTFHVANLAQLADAIDHLLVQSAD